MARPKKYNIDTEEVYKLASYGCSNVEIADFYGCDESLIRNVKIFDLYEGENIPGDKKSIALSVIIQSFEKTLNDQDLEKINNLIISTVENKTGAKLRS